MTERHGFLFEELLRTLSRKQVQKSELNRVLGNTVVTGNGLGSLVARRRSSDQGNAPTDALDSCAKNKTIHVFDRFPLTLQINREIKIHALNCLVLKHVGIVVIDGVRLTPMQAKDFFRMASLLMASSRARSPAGLPHLHSARRPAGTQLQRRQHVADGPSPPAISWSCLPSKRLPDALERRYPQIVLFAPQPCREGELALCGEATGVFLLAQVACWMAEATTYWRFIGNSPNASRTCCSTREKHPTDADDSGSEASEGHLRLRPYISIRSSVLRRDRWPRRWPGIPLRSTKCSYTQGVLASADRSTMTRRFCRSSNGWKPLPADKFQLEYRRPRPRHEHPQLHVAPPGRYQ